MYPATAPLVPDDQYHDQGFAPRDLDAERDFSNQRMRVPRRQGAIKQASIGGRIVRSVIRFLAAVLIGVGLTLAWQTHGDEINDAVAGWAPSVAALLPAQTVQKPVEPAIGPEMAQQIKLIAVDLAIVRRTIGQLTANQDQFAARQEQMNQNIATLQRVEQDVRQQVPSPPAPKAPPHPPAPPARSPLQTSPR